MSIRPPRIPRPAPPPVTLSPIMTALGEHPDAAAVAEFWEHTAATTPIIEPVGSGQAIVTFCWRDAEAEEVLLFANRITGNDCADDLLMSRVAGTDIWHRSLLMNTTWRASYAFWPRYRGQVAPWLDAEGQVAIRPSLDRAVPDPRGTAICPSWSGAIQSMVELPDAAPQPWLRPRTGVASGSFTESVRPWDDHEDRRIWVYESAGLVDEPRDLLIVLDGRAWTPPEQDLPTTLDNLLADGLIGAVRAIMVDPVDEVRRAADVAARDIDRWVAGALLPWAYEMWSAPRRVVVIGQSLGGVTALRTALRLGSAHDPTGCGRIDAVIAQSASLWHDDFTELDALDGVRVRLQVGLQEWALVDRHRELSERMRDRGIDATLRYYDGGHDYAWWRGGLPDALVELLRPTPGIAES